MRDRLVLAYSGGLAATAAVPWLHDRYGAEVVAVVVGVGQRGDLVGIRDQALAAGAVRCHVLDLESAFAVELLWPMTRVGVHPDLSPVWLVMPLVARALTQIARMEHAAAVAHGAVGLEAAQLDVALRGLDPALAVLRTPVHELPDRRALQAYLEGRGRSVPADPAWRSDVTLWGRRAFGPALADAWQPVPSDLHGLTRTNGDLSAPARLDVSFERGWPTAINGVQMPLLEILDSVGTIAGAHGVGRRDVVVADALGRPQRELRETPALTVLRQAHSSVAQLVAPLDAEPFDVLLAREYAMLLRDGRWFSPARRALDACADTAQASVTGTARVTLSQGGSQVIGRRLEQV